MAGCASDSPRHVGRPTAWTLRAQGDRCLNVDLLAPFDAEVGAACLRVAGALRDAALPGVTDIVASFTSVALLFGRGITDAQHRLLLDRLPGLVDAAMAGAAAPRREVEIPVCYGGEHGPDLEQVAAAAGIDPQELVRRHGLPGASVMLLGFAPGQPYIGLQDPVFAVPRRTVPRTRVPAGAVAVANRQTTIYANASPGGWHLIGMTPGRLFDARREPPTLLQPGDRIRFRAIDEDELARLAAGGDA